MSYIAKDGKVYVREGAALREVSTAQTTVGRDLEAFEGALAVARHQRESASPAPLVVHHLGAPRNEHLDFVVEWLDGDGSVFATDAVRKPDLTAAVRWGTAQLTRGAGNAAKAHGMFVRKAGEEPNE